VKTAEHAAKKALKTAQNTAKATHKTAQATTKAAKAAAQVAKAATKAAITATKAAAKATTAFLKAAIAAIRGLVAVIMAGGWVAVAFITITCLIAMLVGSIFGIFYSGKPDPNTGQTINSVISEIDTEYTDEIDNIISSNHHDILEMSGARASWKEVLAIYTVRTVSDPDNPLEVATMNNEKAAILRTVFWDMNIISYTLDMIESEENVLDIDNQPTGETYTVTYTVLRITVSHMTADEMAVQYGFNDERTEWLEELLKPEYHSLWNSLLYGITSIGDGSMIAIAETQIGNVGGEPYWRWYGFSSRVAWCACFVSWVADQCGYIDAGIIPRFSVCTNGVQWFQDRNQWQDNTYTPAPGDIIFFDWDLDGECSHVGIVENVANGMVNTIEGNSSDLCRRRSYALSNKKIYGYGIPVYQ
jgi:cell wall-associated NlpC family hydrolase